LSPFELRKTLPGVVSDALLLGLHKDRAEAEQKLASLTVLYANDHPEVKRVQAVIKQIEAQMTDREDGIMKGLEARSGGPGAASANPEPSLAELEQKEIRRLQALIKDSPDLINGQEMVTGNTPLRRAAEGNQLAVAKFLLDSGADINFRTSANGVTPLLGAVNNGHKGMVEFLLSRGADINLSGTIGTANFSGTPLHRAVELGFKSVVSSLLAHQPKLSERDQFGRTPLQVAAGRGFLSIVEELIKAGASVKEKSADNETPLHSAAASGNKAVLEFLLTHEAELEAKSKQGKTPLMIAMERRDTVGGDRLGSISALLSAGADVNATDTEGQTPLTFAIQRRSPEILQELLRFKPKLNEKTRGVTPLLRAVEMESTPVLKLLLEAGADPDLGSYGNDYRPLHAAVGRNNKSMVELLLAHHANPNVVDASGESPLSYARRKNTLPQNTTEGDRLEIEHLLLEAGADANLQRRAVIAVSRSGGARTSWFFKGANVPNRYSLFELIAGVYAETNTSALYQFPDLSKVRLKRLDPSGHEGISETPLDAALRRTGEDQMLLWGDIVEIPERDHGVSEAWTGLDDDLWENLQTKLGRSVTIIVKGERTKVWIKPPTDRTSHPPRVYLNDAFAIRIPKAEPGHAMTILGNRLRPVLEASGLLRTSSDTTRVKVKRTRPDPAEFVLDLTKGQSSHDLWLRDGDVIDVPEK
jgi:ankyrin repeat protein